MFSAVFLMLFAGSAGADLAARIQEAINTPIQQGVKFSINIVNPATGTTVYEYDARKQLTPASNMKAVTTAAAISYLGGDYEYKTRVGLIGNTLVIIGSGDPLFGDTITDQKYDREKNWILKRITQALQENGISEIEGIIVDTGIFDDQCVHENWPSSELNRWYACEVSGLNYNVNCINVSAKNVDGVVQVFTEPDTAFITLINQVEPITSGTSVIGTLRNRQPNKLTVTGRCKDQIGPFEVAIERPAAMFGFVLYEFLSNEQITVSGELSEADLDDYSHFNELVLFTTPLSDCLIRCNKDSLGLAAESLLKTIAAKNDPNDKNGSWEKGCELLGQYLQKLGVSSDEFNIDDGSGLSRENGLSAYSLTATLLDVYKSNYWQMYQDSLSIGGIDGTLEAFFKDRKYQGKVLGKTGYISGVRSMSGVCITEKGPYIYSIIANNAYSISRATLNQVAQAVIDENSEE